MRSWPVILKPSYWARHPWRALGVLLALMLGVRLAWGWYAGHRLAAALDEIRRRGEPASLADVVYPPLPDAQNAAAEHQRAAAALSTTVESPTNSNLDYFDYLPYPPKWTQLAEASEKANTKAFAILRQSRPLTSAQYRRSLTSLWAANFTYINRVKELTNVVSDGAIYSHLQGDDTEALERLFDVMHVASSFRQDDLLISQLVVIGIDSKTCTSVQLMAPGLRLDSRASTRPNTRQQVCRLIDQLLDEQGMGPQLRRAVVIERIAWLDFLNSRSSGNWAIKPLADMHAVRLLPDYDLTIQATQCTSHPEALAILKRGRWEKPQATCDLFGASRVHEIPRYSRWYDLITSNLTPYFERYFRNLGERRATAVVLACQLYRADHGRWPNALAQLMPEYLPAVPADPFHADSRSIGYTVFKGELPGGQDRPLVYFDAGQSDDVVIAGHPMYGWQHDSRVGRGNTPTRQYRDLTRFPPTQSTKTVGNDPQKTNTPR
ncbi:MAG: hypothetical protein ABSH20_00580 [Tepidisphaeraceae bacterium]|jgi:hypothetical protein